ncbi:hypothetical protein [Streptococcus suis]|uniref:hypothetical protein n=1 Tax=Streptococcus suis TaxID=1307 RepID=UPI00211B8D23|nr:hypothetical protein [Streptococcus suis]UUM23835.1 hypothetical protein NQZ84_02525 [Streptococcus suis]
MKAKVLSYDSGLGVAIIVRFRAMKAKVLSQFRSRWSQSYSTSGNEGDTVVPANSGLFRLKAKVAIIVPLPGNEGESIVPGDSGLGGRNHIPLPGLEGDTVVPGDSGLGGRNHSPLPGNEGESIVPGDSGLGGRNHSPLPGNEGESIVPGDSGLGGRNHIPFRRRYCRSRRFRLRRSQP